MGAGFACVETDERTQNCNQVPDNAFAKEKPLCTATEHTANTRCYRPGQQIAAGTSRDGSKDWAIVPATGSNSRSSTSVQRSLVLVGFMAAGKSRIGSSLADKLGMEFVDADRLIEQEHGCSIAEIFRQFGEERFREAERNTILRLIGDQPKVLAVGGGAFVNDHVRQTLIAKTVTIWLDTPFELLVPRIAKSKNRPLAANRSEAELKMLFEERQAAYCQAHIRVDTSDADIERIVGRIVAKL